MSLSVDPEIGKASTLPSAFYKDPVWFAASREKLFAGSWQFIGTDEVVRQPGAVAPFTLLEGFLDEPMVLTRDMHDRLNLLSNVCTHRGMAVAEGCSNERFLRCRYHGRRFGLDGKFQHMPEFEGVEGFPSEHDDLAKPPFAQWSKFLFASVYADRSFEECFGPMISRLSWLPLDEFVESTSLSQEYLIKANWALYVDNFLEGFHIPFVHQSLNEALDYENYESELFGQSSLQLGVGKQGDCCFDLPSGSPDYGRNIAAYYWWVFPNTMFNFYPWGLSINVVRPLEQHLTKVAAHRFVWKPELVSVGAGAGLDRVEREDDVVVELVQRGVRSRFYDRGRYSPRREQNVHHFHRLVSRQLGT